MTTTRTQSKAMSTPQTSPTQQKPESPKSTSSQESPGSTISQETSEPIPSQETSEPIPSQESHENIPSQDSPLSPGWVHAITIIMGYPLKSEIGQKLQKWDSYHLIHDPTNFWLSLHPTDSDDIRLFQKYTESNGSVVYLPSSIVKNLIGLWDYMNLLIKQDRPADQ